MARSPAIGTLAIGALFALGFPSQEKAAAVVSAPGDSYVTNLDGNPIHAREVKVAAGIHGMAVEYREHEMSAWCVFFCRLSDHCDYRIRTEVQPTGFVRIWLLGRNDVPQVVWTANRPGGKLIPSRALDVHLQSLDRFEILVDARMLPGHN